MRYEIRFAGFGGQGIVTMGIILGRAAAIYEGLNAVQTQSYGPEARGGASRSEVIISDSPIYYPKVRKPDIFVCMSVEAFKRYIKDLKEKGILIYDSSIIKDDIVKEILSYDKYKVYKVPATKMAFDTFGKTIVANIIMLGALIKITGIVSYESLKKSVLDVVPKGTEEMNLKALEIGYEYDEDRKS